MLSLWIYCLLLAFYSPLLSAISCKSSVIPVQVVTDIQKCICDVQVANAVCCDAASSQLDELQSQVDSLIDVIDDIISGISNFDTFISQYDILVDIARSIDLNLVRSLVATIFSTGSSFDHITSLIDADIVIDETILSTVSVIDANLGTMTSLVDDLIIQNCASSNDLISSDLEQLSDAVHDLESLLEQISAIDNLIVSHLSIIDTKVDDVESALDVLVADQACASRQEILLSNLDSLRQQEASCCQQLSEQLTTLQEDVDSRLEQIVSISLIEQVADILSIADSFQEQFASYIQISQSGFDYITSRLDLLQECAPIPIQVQAPVTLATPGNYCLMGDGSGNITIASSGVLLNLNNHVLSGSITVNAGLQDISIYNGRLNGSGSSSGVLINQSCNTILLSDLFITNFQNGVNLAGTLVSPITNVFIDKLTAYRCNGPGIAVVETSGQMINSVTFNNETGVNINNTNSFFTITNTQAIFNASGGFAIENTINFGVLSIAIYDSIACDNAADGFFFNNATFYVENCISQSNGIGFSVGDRNAATDNQGAIVNCKAIANGTAGFLISNLAGTNVRFVGNYGVNNINNTTKYDYAKTNGASNVVVAQNQPPYYWLYSNSTSTEHNNVTGV